MPVRSAVVGGGGGGGGGLEAVKMGFLFILSFVISSSQSPSVGFWPNSPFCPCCQKAGKTELLFGPFCMYKTGAQNEEINP